MRHAFESFIRPRFYVVHLVLITVAAVLSARIVTTIVGHYVAESMKASDKETKAVPPRGTSPRAWATRDFAAASVANIFEGKREQVQQAEAPVEVAPPPTDEQCVSAVPTTMRLRLVGTLVFSNPEYSTASIVDENKGGSAAGIYSANACVELAMDPNDPNAKLVGKAPPCNRLGDNAVVRRIEPEQVCIWNESERRLELVRAGAPKGEPPPPRPGAKKEAEAPAAADTGRDIRKTGENTYEVGQGEVDKALNNLAELSTQARIVPAFEGGKTVGFKLFSIRPSSLYSKIGLQNGDVVTRINGYEITSPEKGLELYAKLKDSKQVTVDVKRRGKPMTLDYNITP